MYVKAIRTKIFRESDDLYSFIIRYLPRIDANSVLAVTSKIAALAEARTAPLSQKIKLIRSESEFAVKTKYVWLTVKDGMAMASAGIDESNADGKLILLPRDSFKLAEELRARLCLKYNLRNFGVIITDSRTAPFRAGITGVALGYAGFSGIKSYVDKPDIFGRFFHFSSVDIADSLATAAVLEMGEGNEQRPLALLTDLKQTAVRFRSRIDRNELHIDIKEDMYAPLSSLFSKTKRNRGKNRS